ncbi:rhodopsin-like [Paramacrobiotus metropolitanus]|uniref:rhodopsin-like n=1 Tax=Paramacrobiotus metropolitanus TaxID=2943436 RepID=UPI0024459B6B|nr:rhodopsin-like [Paramacrobiotus metropolitanus]
MNRSNSTTSSTAIVVAAVPVLGIIRIAILISSFILNAIVLSVYLMRPKLRTPFCIYIICLLSSNILELLLLFPFTIANDLGTNANRFVLGKIGCSVYGYGVSITRSCCLCSHALITINRIWAMTFPISYKNVHSSRFAAILCICVILALHAIMIQGLVLSERTRPRPVEKWGCWYQVRTGSIATSVGFHSFFTLPVVIVATYPYLFCKYLKARKQVMAQDGKSVAPADAKASRTFGVVTMLSLCTIVCWLPELLVVILMNNVGTRAIFWSYPYVSFFSCFQVLFDPMFLLITSRELRYGLLSVVCGKTYATEKLGTLQMVTLARSSAKHHTVSSRV